MKKAMTKFIRIAYEDSNYAKAALDAAQHNLSPRVIRCRDISYIKGNAVYLMSTTPEADAVAKQYLLNCVGALPSRVNR